MSSRETTSKDDSQIAELKASIRSQAWILVVFFVPLHLILLMANIIANSATADETAHLASGIAMWQQGRFDLYAVNPPLVRLIAALPAYLSIQEFRSSHMQDDPGLRPEWSIGRDLARQLGREFLLLVLFGRLACMPFSVAGLLVTSIWASKRLGWCSGLAVATLWTFSPIILANGSLFTSDLGSGSFGFIAFVTFNRWLRRPSLGNAILAGIVLGLAEATKMTLVVLFPLYLLVWISRRAIEAFRKTVPSARLALRSQVAEFGLIISLALLTLGALYGFTGMLAPLGSLKFYSNSLGGVPTIKNASDGANYVRSGNRFKNTILGKFPIPVPAPYLQGLDIQRRDFEGGWFAFDSYAAGMKAKHGWWWYYFYCMGVKSPIPLLFLFLLAIPPSIRWAWAAMKEPGTLTQVVIPLAITALIISETSFSRCFRYVLVVWPFYMVVLSTTLSSYASFATQKVASICLIFYALTSLSATPQHLSYFNLFVGGSMGGHHALLDSNLDWGQEMFRLNVWRSEHPSEPLFLAVAGTLDPDVLGIQYRWPPESNPGIVPELEPGWYVISANQLHGFDSRGEGWEYFRNLTPVERVGHTLFVFRVTPSLDVRKMQ